MSESSTAAPPLPGRPEPGSAGPGSRGTGPAVSVAGRERRLAERLAELWRYRHLVGNLVVRDLKVRYKNSVLGFFWSLVNPLLMMAVLSLVFGFIFPIGEARAPHLFILVAILPWNWFNAAVAGGITSITNNAPLINKVYFPREVLPIGVVLSELVNFLFALPVLLAIVALTPSVDFTRHMLWLPLIILIQGAFTLGFVLLLATANVYYRDTHMIMDVVLLAWFFLTPIFYEGSMYDRYTLSIGGQAVPGSRIAFIVNPLASLIANYRVVIYGSMQGPPSAPDLLFLGRTALTALVVLVGGYWVFHRYSGQFGEEV